MIDCSRNAVLTPEALRMILRKMALMGLNMGMMYTEDTYEVPEEALITKRRSDGTFGNTNVMEEIATSSKTDW